MKKKRVSGGAAGLLMLAAACSSAAADMQAQMAACAGTADDRERLLCYDRAAGRSVAPPEAAGAAAAPVQAPPMAMAGERREEGREDSTRMMKHWELGAADKLGIFNFRPHQENYLIATYNPSPNEDPYRPFRAVAPDAPGLSHAELAFQLGFKLKLSERPADLPLDLWFGYTQRSFWQADNQEASSPFRETDYQPELMAVMPVNLDLLGLKMRFVNVGLVHQSNGQGSTLSRSWNRAYVQAGFERGNFELLARAWKRFNEDADEDNNPRIIDYMGHGDLLATYRSNGHELSLLTRYNFSTDKGAAQIGWAFPLTTRLKGYVQYFSGYGHTLIDYDAHQNVVGLGVLVTY